MRVLFVNFNNNLSRDKDFFIRLQEQHTITNLACLANTLVAEHHLVRISDYDIENKPNNTIFTDVEDFRPHIIIAHIENKSMGEELRQLYLLKNSYNNCKIVIHNNHLYYTRIDLLKNFHLDVVDVILKEEPDDIIHKLLDAMFDNYPMKRISNVRYKDENKVWKQTDSVFFNHLDLTATAYRKGLKNELYKDIAGTKPMALIQCTRGSLSDCIYSNTQSTEGRKIRFRSPEMIAREVLNCYTEFGITEFYLETDCFNFDDKWAYDVAYGIRDTEAAGKIHFTTRINLKDLNIEVVEQMQFAGFNLAVLNLCSGNEESLKRAKIGVSDIEIYRKGIEVLHKFGIRTYGVYKVGFPWETKKHINDTSKLINEFNHTYLDCQILSPEYDTPALDICKVESVVDNEGGFTWKVTGTKYLKLSELEKLYKSLLSSYKFKSKFSKEKVVENLYQLSDNDKKALRRK